MIRFTPTPYPIFELEWPLAWVLVGAIMLMVFPFAASIYFLITVPISIFFCLRYLIDLVVAWLDHKWGYQVYLRDRIAELSEAIHTPCGIHTLSGEDPACPYLHTDQTARPV